MAILRFPLILQQIQAAEAAIDHTGYALKAMIDIRFILKLKQQRVIISRKILSQFFHGLFGDLRPI